jgi:cyclase
MRPAAANPFARRPRGQLEALSERAFLWRNVVNSTVFVGERGLAVVDTQVNPGLARALLAALAERFAKPVLYAINTHYHWDHCSGNQVFAEAGATLVCSRRTAVALQERQPRQRSFLASRGFTLGPDPLIPGRFAEDHPPLDLGGLTLELRQGLVAESPDPTLVWCPEERVLASGDTVMTGSFPILGQPSQQEGLENDAWLAALDEVRGFGAAVIAPGHGPAAREPELALFERTCRWFLDEVARQFHAGLTLDQAIAAIEAGLPEWIRAMPQVWGTPRYAVLRVWAGLADLRQPGWQHVKPSAIPRRFPVEDTAPGLAAWQERVRACLEGGDLAGALGHATVASEDRGRDPGAWTLLGTTLITASRSVDSVLEKGDFFDAAKRAFSHALALKPDFVPALLALGQYHALLALRGGDDSGEARALLERAEAAAASARERAEAVFWRGICERADGAEAAARACFLRAQELAPGFPPAALALAG